MSNVTVELAGRRYTVACGEGEEAHITMLGETIEGKLTATLGLSGQSAERTLLYAALLLADELHEANSKSASSGATSSDPASSGAGEWSDKATEILEDLANSLETLASRLESAEANA